MTGVQHMEPRCTGRRCVVVGSAPGVRLPEHREGDCYVAANGAARVLHDHLRPVDVLCTTAYLFRLPPVTKAEEATINSLFALSRVGSVWVDTTAGPAEAVVSALGRLGIQWDTAWGFNPPGTRERVVAGIVGSELRVSTGIFAACLAIASGASEVVLCGISLEPGHEGMPWDEAPRDHVTEDRQALAALFGRENVRMMDLEVAA